MDTEAEVLILWPLDAKSPLTGKDLDAGKDWRQEEKWVTQDEMAGWHHWPNGHEFKQLMVMWQTGKSGMVQSMGLQKVRHDLVTEQQQL